MFCCSSRRFRRSRIAACGATALIAPLAACGAVGGSSDLGAGYTTTTSTLRPSATGEPVVTEEGGGQPDLVIVDQGFSTFELSFDEPVITAGAVVENRGEARAKLVEVVFTFEDAAGKPVDTQTGRIAGIEPGGVGHAALSLAVPAAAPARMRTAVLSSDFSTVSVSMVDITIDKVAPGPYRGVTTVRGTADNPTDKVIRFAQLACVLRLNGKIVGGNYHPLDTIVPHGTIAWNVTGNVKADAADCSASTDL